MIYLLRYNDNIFDYKKICDEISLTIINPIINKMGFPLLNGNDIQMLRNSGGTVVYRESGDVMVWIINLDHKQDIRIGVILGSELVNIVGSLRESIKRDLVLNNVLG